MKKVLAVALSIVAALSTFACADPNADGENEVGERIDAEKFEELVFYGVCCDNYTRTDPKNTTTTYTYGNNTYTVVSTGEQIFKLAENVLSIYTDVTTVTTVVSVDSSGNESSTQTTETEQGTIYVEKVGETCYTYEYDKGNSVWVKSEGSFYSVLFPEEIKALADSLMENADETFKEEMDFYKNIENWTFDETTGEYSLLDFTFTYSNIQSGGDVYYKFKDGHIMKSRNVTSTLGIEVDQTSYYSNHGTTVVTLPVIEDSSSSSVEGDSSSTETDSSTQS